MRIGVVGCGYWGPNLVRNFSQAKGSEVVAVCDVRRERLEVVLRYATAEDALGAAFAGGPVALAYSRFDEPTRDGAHDEYLQSIAPYRRGDGYEIPGEYVVALATRS